MAESADELGVRALDDGGDIEDVRVTSAAQPATSAPNTANAMSACRRILFNSKRVCWKTGIDSDHRIVMMLWLGDEGKEGSVTTQGLARIVAGLVLATASLGAFPLPVAADTYPGYVKSWYMDTVNTTTTYNMGCSLGTARAGGSAPQDALVILDFGQPQLRSGVYGGYLFGGAGYATVTAIRNAVVEYAHGFWICTDTNTTARVTIAVGTSNYEHFSELVGMTYAQVLNHAKAWGNMVNDINDELSTHSYASQATAYAAGDFETSWSSGSLASDWVDAYDTVNSWPFYNFGDAGGCPTSGATTTAASCGSFDQDDVYWISYGAPPAYAVPEIYLTNENTARQWQQVSKHATLINKTRINFKGSLTQLGSCGPPPSSCSAAGTDNPPADGWQQLYDRCNSNTATAISDLRFAADIRHH